MSTLAEILLVGVVLTNAFLMDRSRRHVDQIGVGLLFGPNVGLANAIQRINYISAALGLVAVGLMALVLGNWHGRELMLETQRDTAEHKLAAAESHRQMVAATQSPVAAAPRPAAPSTPAAAQSPVVVAPAAQREPQAAPRQEMVRLSGSQSVYVRNAPLGSIQTRLSNRSRVIVLGETTTDAQGQSWTRVEAIPGRPGWIISSALSES